MVYCSILQYIWIGGKKIDIFYYVFLTVCFLIYVVIDRPGVAGAVLEAALFLIN